MAPAATSVPPDSAVLILELPQGDRNVTVAVIVDEVHEVISLNEETIESGEIARLTELSPAER